MWYAICLLHSSWARNTKLSFGFLLRVIKVKMKLAVADRKKKRGDTYMTWHSSRFGHPTFLTYVVFLSCTIRFRGHHLWGTISISLASFPPFPWWPTWRTLTSCHILHKSPRERVTWGVKIFGSSIRLWAGWHCWEVIHNVLPSWISRRRHFWLFWWIEALLLTCRANWRTLLWHPCEGYENNEFIADDCKAANLSV